MRAGGVPGVQWSRSNQGLLISRKRAFYSSFWSRRQEVC